MWLFLRRRRSCQVAKDRLKILLITDRVNCSPEMVELIKRDITKVMSQYVKIDTENMEIQISTKKSNSRGGKAPVLYANVPILDLHKQGRQLF